MFQFTVGKKKIDDMVYETMDTDTLSEITKKDEVSKQLFNFRVNLIQSLVYSSDLTR